MNTTRDDEALERLLRRTLTSRADSVTRPAAWSTADPAPAPGRRWLAPLAAAVAAVAIAGTIVGIEQATHHDHPKPPQGTGTPTRIVSPTPSPSPSRTAAPITLNRTCTTALPPAWKAAIANGTTTAGATSANPLFVAADGQVLVSRDFGSDRDVALLTPNGSVRSIFSVPSPNENQALTGVVEGPWALITVSRLPRNSNGVLPTVVRVVLVNLHDGAQRVVATGVALTDGRRVDGATLYEGEVYYDVRASYGSNTSAIHRYDIRDRSDRVIAHSTRNGTVRGPALVPQGVVWSTDGMQVGVPRSLPAAVRTELVAGRVMADELSSDGTVFAWSRSPTVFGYWRPGMAAARYFQIAGRDQHFVLGVVGRTVLVEGGTPQVGVLAVDTRTGATAGLAGVQGLDVQATNWLAYYAFTGSFKESPTAVVRFDASRLPELKC